MADHPRPVHPSQLAARSSALLSMVETRLARRSCDVDFLEAVMHYVEAVAEHFAPLDRRDTDPAPAEGSRPCPPCKSVGRLPDGLVCGSCHGVGAT